MSSNINTIAARIDAAFPVAGQDNSSQGFRDNFSAIKLAFSTATNEISNLQLTSAQLNQSNDFQFTDGGIKRAKIQNSGFVANNTGATTGELNYTLANYYKVQTTTATNATTFSVINWPALGIYAQLRLEVVAPLDNTHNVGFDAISGIVKSNITLPETISTGTTHVYDLWTTNNGATVFVHKVGGPYA